MSKWLVLGFKVIGLGLFVIAMSLLIASALGGSLLSIGLLVFILVLLKLLSG